MGSVFSSNAVSSPSVDESSVVTPVFLNVYDLSNLNNYFYWCGLGIYHSGIEVHGLEYGFGAHEFPSSGVFEVEPRRCPGYTYRCSILLGQIRMPPSDLQIFMENTAAEYHGDTYQLISKNCNHFTDDICLRLTGKRIPGWVNRLAYIGAMCSCLLPESFVVPVVKQTSEYHICSGHSDDGLEYLSIIPGRELTESDDADQDKHFLSPSSGGDLAFIKESHR